MRVIELLVGAMTNEDHTAVEAGARASSEASANPPLLADDAQVIAQAAAEPDLVSRAGLKHAKDFPIVGIGASAGGLEALEVFLKNVPARSGMAFVIVQHLDPSHEGLLAELLQRGTPMSVAQVEDSTEVHPDCVYVIPPNRDMALSGGYLQLLSPGGGRAPRLPIDFFFHTLAEEQRQRSIGVILSGMGYDGTEGLRAIKARAGFAVAQEPTTAKFDGMPTSAIDSGLVDVVAAVEALPAEILAHIKRVFNSRGHSPAEEADTERSFHSITSLLKARTGHDFLLYKKNTVHRRIERRMGILQIGERSNYERFVRENPQELDLLFKELLIGVTSFFRDPEAWERLKAEILPALVRDRSSNQQLRAWVAGCATGEEAYSLAIVFTEVVAELDAASSSTLRIFATDLDPDAIDKAREGIFPTSIDADVSPERLRQFFLRVERGYQINKSIREMVVFAPQNVVMDPPFTRLDMVSCRNLLIYLTAELQSKLLPLFHYSLNSGGVLLLGSAETTGEFGDLFTPLDVDLRLYSRRESLARTEPVVFPSQFPRAMSSDLPQRRTSKPTASLQSLADELLLRTYSPAAVMADEHGDILYISGRTGKYLEPASGKANWNVFAMVREGLRFELDGAFRKALREKEAVVCKNLKVTTDGGFQALDLTVQSISEPEALRGLVMVVFADVMTPPAPKSSHKGRQPPNSRTGRVEIERRLEEARQESQTIRELMQSSQEELKSTSEEFQSMNEELQSTNEELTTSKEEMQSMNEELHTLNQELRAKVEDLSRLNNDMQNLIDSTEIATLFLDGELRVRLFTAGSNRLFKLIPGDVGRPITDIASDLLYDELIDHAQAVLRTLVTHSQQVPTRAGHWFIVRIMPYNTLDHMIDGVVLTFADITAFKMMEATLSESLALLQCRVTDQVGKLDAAKALEESLRRAQVVLEKRFDEQAEELRVASAELHAEPGKWP